MNTPDTTSTILGDYKIKMILSALWAFTLFNYVYADIAYFAYILMNAALLEKFRGASFGSFRISGGVMLAAAVYMEIPIAMGFLSWVLPRRSNRLMNAIVGAMMSLVSGILLIGTIGKPSLWFYAFFQAVEIVATVAIVRIALRWHISSGPAPGLRQAAALH